MDLESNKVIVSRFVEEVFEQQRVESVDDLVAHYANSDVSQVSVGPRR